MSAFEQDIIAYLDYEWGVSPKEATTIQLYDAVSRAALKSVRAKWADRPGGKRACYLSMEFLVGRLVYANLANLGLLDDTVEFLHANDRMVNEFEEIEDAALGNGGLGRLAACFLDSAATHDIPLDGYGIRYKYGLFKQSFDQGFQKESPDDWQRFGDPWSVRREDASVIVRMNGGAVRAVPYDMPVVGFGGGAVNTLRLWQAEALKEFDFKLFNDCEYTKAVQEKNRAEDICAVLYPNDDTEKGKKLRIAQEYFFSSASLQSIVRDYVKENGGDFSRFDDYFAIQLNDTHPVVAIPEFLRILMSEYELCFDEAFEITKNTFGYTNHTVMSEALEKWDVALFNSVLPEVYPYVVMLQNALSRELSTRGVPKEKRGDYNIIDGGKIHMARLASYSAHSVNGVARIHTEILKNSVLAPWYSLYPERFNNKTNGITQRRWLGVCNAELGSFVTELIGDKWLKDLSDLKRLEPLASDERMLRRFIEIKRVKKRQLCEYVLKAEDVKLSPDFIFDVQVKRLHEYKRQLLNAFSVLNIYFGLKDKFITDFNPTVYLFGAKAAPGYRRAKAVIKYINEIASLVNSDNETNGKLKVLFVQNYNVSYAEKLIPAADISEQISTAGTEASGTGNMKFMLNGAVTLGTLDGANIEIVEQAGRENNYIFGATVEELQELAETGYDPRMYYKNSPRLARAVNTLIDGTFSDGKTGDFKELYDSLLEGTSWHKPDQYYLFRDFEPYIEAKLQANRDYSDTLGFARKCFLNMANAGEFSSDRAIRQYASEIWGL